MHKYYLCSRCNKLSTHYLAHETQYTATIAKRFWNCFSCGDQSDIQEIDILNIR